MKTAPLGTEAETEAAFLALADQWRRERGHLSSITRMATLWPYQRIIGMGPVAVPFLLRELERQPDHWFWALRAITGENSVPPESRGNVREMAACWVRWGRDKGYRW